VSHRNAPLSETGRLRLARCVVEDGWSLRRAAKGRQAAEQLALGATYGSWDYVVSNEIGEPYAPGVLSRYWRETVKAAGIRHIKLHAARHTCATLMHLQGVPVAVIAAWIGHKDASLTMKLYAHSQDDALKAAGGTLNWPGAPSRGTGGVPGRKPNRCPNSVWAGSCGADDGNRTRVLSLGS
jgi:integrase